MSRVYSGLDRIERADAPECYINGCLVLEGGAFRGIYTGGVIDALMKNGINMSAVVGVSAGALNGVDYASGQIGRAGIATLEYRNDSRYVGTTALKNNNGIIGFDFMFGEFADKLYPFNYERFFRKDHRYVAVASCLETGKTVYFEKDSCKEEIFKAAAASASIPYVSRSVEIGGRHYLDGGCTCKIAYKWALKQGYEKIIVVRTRHRSFRRKQSVKDLVMAEQIYGHKYPLFAKRLGLSSGMYNHQCDEIDRLTDEGRLYTIYPSSTEEVSRMEGDTEVLGERYWLGYNDTLSQMDSIKAYLGIG